MIASRGIVKCKKDNKMDIQKQCCSLEQAKKLKELGVEYSDCFWMFIKSSTVTDDNHFLADKPTAGVIGYTEMIPAFTVTELGVMLPEFCDSRKDGSWWVCEEGLTGDCVGFHDDTETEARAAILIYLLENNLTTAEECNKRLSS